MLATGQPDYSRIGESQSVNRKEGRKLAAATLEFTLQNRSGMAALIHPIRIESSDGAGKSFLLICLPKFEPDFQQRFAKTFLR